MDNSIQKSFEQDAKIIQERMPMDVTGEKARGVAESLREFMEKFIWSQTKVADGIGVSAAQISQFLADKYKGNLQDLCNKIVNLINTVSRQERRVKGQFYIETSVAKKIATLITQTESFSGKDAEGKIALIIGDGGHGKSHCLRQYAEANKNTVYVELDDAMTPTLIFAEIANKLGIDSSGYLAAVTRALIDNLQNRQIIIMLDEASSLSVKVLNQLRQIIVVKSRCPLILAGNRHLLDTVMQPTTRRGYESLDQFTSRLMAILDLDKLAADKDGGLYTVEDIRKLYQYGGLRLTNDAIGALRKICRTSRTGRLRTCSHIITALHMARSIEQAGVITAEAIIAAIEELDLPVKVRLPIGIAEEEEAQQVQEIAKTA